ncbi:MAG: 3-phosphoglycerate dehydrogenase, partial [Bacteroidales bacterium]|nr:3-phosphoglycerate dehydrogenase [Bacteroidales bacterium]
MKILVATEKPFAPVAVEGIREIIQGAGFGFELLEKYTDKNSLIEVVSQADGVIIRSDIIDRQVIEAAGKLKIVVRAGAGYDNVDLEAASEKDICVMNTPG